MNPTHDWHVGTDGMELTIRRDEIYSVGVHLGHENIDDSHGTVIITSRLLEMIDSVQPGAVRAYLEQQEPGDAPLTDAEWREFQSIPDQGYSHRAWVDQKITERLSAARAARRDEEHVHAWRWKQNTTSRGFPMPPIEVCPCGAARDARRDEEKR